MSIGEELNENDTHYPVITTSKLIAKDQNMHVNI